MDGWLMWTLIGIGGLAALYILFFVVVILTIAKFKKKLDKRREALRLLLAQCKDIVLSLYKTINNQKIQVPMSLQNKVNELANKKIGLFNQYEVFDYAPKLERISKAVFELAETSKALKKSEEFLRFKKEISELDEIKRQHIAIYNADINGYNYWIRFMSYRRILSGLGFSEKKRLD
ncbi:MAG: hypothetical protein WC344_04085 [Bacilli bacterium]|jgi:hypothetical protein